MENYWIDILWLVGLALACAAGVLITVFQLSGTWLILAVAVLYSWQHDWTRLTPTVLVALGLLAAFGEVWEFAASAWLAGRAGASRRASWYALGGGIIGMFVFAVPVPVIGAIIGGMIGCFAGAVLGEMSVRSDMRGATRIGAWAAAGRVLGTVGKLAVTFAMAGLTLGIALFATIFPD